MRKAKPEKGLSNGETLAEASKIKPTVAKIPTRRLLDTIPMRMQFNKINIVIIIPITFILTPPQLIFTWIHRKLFRFFFASNFRVEKF